MFLDSLDSSVFLYLFCRFRLNYLKNNNKNNNKIRSLTSFSPSYISAVNLTNEPGNVKIAFRLFLPFGTVTPAINSTTFS